MKKIYAYILLTTLISLSTTCMEKENTHNIQEEKDLLIKGHITHILDLNSIKTQLHNAAKNLDATFDSCQLGTHQSLINFITLMNRAKRFNITEHEMGNFIYQKKEAYEPTPLYFHCLKKYNEAQETLPFTVEDLDNEFCSDSELAKALNITYKYHSMQDIQNKAQQYPAYTNLINKLRIAATPKNWYDYYSHYYCNNALYVYLYSGAKTLLDGYPEYKDVIDFDGFYAKAYKNLSVVEYNAIYNLINLIARIKEVTQEDNEKEFFSQIINYTQPTKTLFGFTISSDDTHFTSTWTKNKMALMYRCIKQYNRDRSGKKTPTGSQFRAFLAYKNLDILLPEESDKTIFNEHTYAFEAFKTLGEKITTILKVSDVALERSVKKILQEK